MTVATKTRPEPVATKAKSMTTITTNVGNQDVDQLLQRVRDLEADLHATTNELIAIDAKPAQATHDVAVNLLAGHDVTVPDNSDRIAKLRLRIRALPEAIVMAKGDLDAARKAAGKEICDCVRPEHKAKVRRLADAVVELANAEKDLREFMHATRSQCGGTHYANLHEYAIPQEVVNRISGLVAGWVPLTTAYLAK